MPDRVWNNVKLGFAIDEQIEFVAADREVTGATFVAQMPELKGWSRHCIRCPIPGR